MARLNEKGQALVQYGSLLIRSSLGQDSCKDVMPEKCNVQGATFALYSLDTTDEGNIVPRSSQAVTNCGKE